MRNSNGSITITIVLSEFYDFDLVNLYRKIGRKSFVKIVRYSLLAIKDSSYLGLIKRQLSEKNQDCNTDCLRFCLAYKNEDADFVESLLEKIIPKKKSALLKQLVRYFVGIENLVPFYLKDDITFETKNVTRLEICGLNTEDSNIIKPKKKKKSNKKASISSSTSKPNIVIKEEPSIKPFMSSSNQSVKMDTSEISIFTTEDSSSDTETMNDDDVLAMLTNILG